MALITTSGGRRIDTRTERDAHVALSEMPAPPAQLFDPLAGAQPLPRRRGWSQFDLVPLVVVGVALIGAVVVTLLGSVGVH